ncbi:transposase [Salmonella enterica]|uniref:IS66 family insertion sequence element accessory protein TnpB n=1 Tax=Salmonella newport TaxID=108619 RepID=A0A5U9VTY1_SALNE|nr:hypothetical protein [Salmonella enterica subsp. enterica serovar Newport]ECB3300484.1 hypothetical protein [Salmonella enterica subsp. enterica serovar Newport]EHI3123112.1 transposase [Salmonella enterica]
MKLLWADTDGLCLFTKLLEECQFIWPAVRDSEVTVYRFSVSGLGGVV